MRTRLAALALAAVALAAPVAMANAAASTTPLTVCVDEDNPPFSAKRKAASSGFDLALAAAIAEHLGRPLALQWFESEYENERSAPLDTAALLSAGVCDLVASYALYADALAPPGAPTARLPDYEGAKGKRGRRVAVEPIAPTQPYYFTGFAVILRPGLADRSVRSLEDLKGLRTGVPAGTLADGILRGWHGGQLVPGLVSLKTRADPLPLLAAGQLDATLIELPKFDAWRARHNDQQLRDSGYRHTLGFNLGYVALAKNAALVAAVNDALDALARENRLERLAAEAGLTWSPPRNPAVMPHITRSVLLGG